MDLIEELRAAARPIPGKPETFVVRSEMFDEAADEIERLRVDAERLHDAIDALGTAPILSKYHGKNGFEVERFINDYAIWKTEVAAPATAPKQVADSSGRAEEET